MIDHQELALALRRVADAMDDVANLLDPEGRAEPAGPVLPPGADGAGGGRFCLVMVTAPSSPGFCFSNVSHLDAKALRAWVAKPGQHRGQGATHPLLSFAMRNGGTDGMVFTEIGWFDDRDQAWETGRQLQAEHNQRRRVI